LSMDIDEQSRDSMDTDDDVSEYISSGFSEEQRYEHYKEIVGNLRHIETNQKLTEDWMQENMFLIRRWRDWFENFGVVNQDITNPDFRKACFEAETLLQNVATSVRLRNTFEVKVYKLLLQKMKYICDSLFQDDEMEMLMHSISLK